MDSKNVATGVKVTYIETQFVTSDAAGFKDLVQRLTGRSSAAPPLVPVPPHRPLPCRPDVGRRGCRTTAAGAHAGMTTQVYQYPAVTEVRPAAVVSRTTPYLELEGSMGLHLHDDYINMDDFSDLFYDVAASSERSDGCYGGFPY